jgi:hypothetical protein
MAVSKGLAFRTASASRFVAFASQCGGYRSGILHRPAPDCFMRTAQGRRIHPVNPTSFT